MSESQKSLIHNSNLYAFTLSLCAFAVSIVLATLEISTMGILALLVSCLFGCALVFNSLKWNRLSRKFLLVVFNLAIYVFSTSLGVDSGTHYWFLTAAILPFTLFELNERKRLVFAFLMPIGLLLLISVTHFNWWILPKIEMASLASNTIVSVMILLSAVTTLSIIYLLVKK